MAKGGQRSKKGPETSSNVYQELDLELDIISSLTKKIEANLKSGPNGKLPEKNKSIANSRGNDTVPKKLKKDSKPSLERDTAVSPLKDGESVTPILNARSKKRLSDGQLKNIAHENTYVNGTKKITKSHRKQSAEHPRLESEILELGGSKDDLALIKDVVSESEFEADANGFKNPESKDLKKELMRVVQELGIDKVTPESDEASTAAQDDNASAGQEADSNIAKPAPQARIASHTAKSRTAGSHFVLEPHPEWYAATLPALTSTDISIVALPPDLVTQVHEHAKSLLEMENERYASRTGSANSDRQFYSTIMSSGTLSDKISALTLSIQESPLHNMKALETLVGLARKRSRGQAVEVLGALKDMFGLGSVLPPDRKLRKFGAQPGLLSAFSTKMKRTSNDPLPKPLTNAHLIFWAFEDWLKLIYFEILKILETWCNDEVVFARGKAIDYVCQLLREKPEQEANLLRLLVNKLGDSDKKIASKTSYHILQLETAHPLMKPTIIFAIESDLLFRPGQNLHAQYYAIITLNQTILSSKEEDVAKKLLDIYFSLFAKLLAKPEPKTSEAATIKINQKGEVQGGGGPAGKAARRKAASKEKATAVEDDLREKMLSAVLTGVNRAVPYTNTNDES